jgi:hypothetical protein
MSRLTPLTTTHSDFAERRRAFELQQKAAKVAAERSCLDDEWRVLERDRERLESERAAFAHERQTEAAEEIAGDLAIEQMDSALMTRDTGKLAAMIIRAGKRRRGEIPDDATPPAGSLAAQIVQAARKARGEIPAGQKPTGLAAKIVAAAAKARGEI